MGSSGLPVPLMPKSRNSARADDRKIMNAIFYVLRTGMSWRDLSERHGPYTTAVRLQSSRRGIWKRIFDALASKSRDSLYPIDSTTVKAHRAAGWAKGGAKLGDRRQPRRPLDEKHAVVDNKGCPLNFALTGGQVHDSQVVGEVLDTPKGRHRRQGLRQRESAPAVKDEGALRVTPSRSTPPRTPIVPSAFGADATKSKTTSAASRTGGISRQATTNKLARNFLAAATLASA